MTIQIFGVAPSSYVRTARMVCIEKGLAHTLENPHDGLHPWKRVPAMKHGDLTLIETSAITRYLDDIGTGPRLVPSTPTERAVMEQWISAINCYIYGTLIRDYAVRGYIVPTRQNREPDRAQIQAALPDLERDLGRLDAGYARTTYLAGETVSLADLFVAPIVQTVGMFPEGQRALAATPNLKRAFDLLARRDSFVQVHQAVQ